MVGLPLAEEGIEEARRARVVDGPLAVLEEDVHELPQHVIARLDQLLADEGIVLGRVELDQQRRRVGHLGAERDHHVVGLGQQLELRVR